MAGNYGSLPSRKLAVRKYRLSVFTGIYLRIVAYRYLLFHPCPSFFLHIPGESIFLFTIPGNMGTIKLKTHDPGRCIRQNPDASA